jgi:capsular polysaccharide transport system permease protein
MLDPSEPRRQFPRLKIGPEKLEIIKREQARWRSDATMVSRKIQTTLRIIHALVLREIMTRFGREHLGFLWLVLEPLLLTTLVMIGMTILNGTTKNDVTIVQLVLTGYSMASLWRHIIARFLHCFRHNAGLMFHRNVKPMDTILGRFFLETTGTLISFFVAYITLYLLDLIGPIKDLTLLLGAWYLLALFSFAAAVCIAALCELWEPLEKFVQPMLYVTLPLTGVFYLVSWMPSQYHHVLLLSPMVNTMEMFRSGMIGPTIQTYYNVEFVIYVTIFLAAFGLLLMRKAEAHIKIE